MAVKSTRKAPVKNTSKKSASSKPTVNRVEPSLFKRVDFLVAELVVLGILTVLLFYQTFALTHKTAPAASHPLSSLPIKIASISAKLKPSPKPQPTKTALASSSAVLAIPQNYGKSVQVPIMMYHYIGNNPNPADKARDVLSTTPDKFDAQMGYLQTNGFTPITFDTMYAAMEGQTALPPKPIILTFDDGYIDFFVNAFPILSKYHFHAVSFIPTGLMNQGYYLSWAQIKQMQSSGLISFEAHSVNHLNLPSLSADQVRYQVIQSKKVLEAELGVPVNFFAYPYGPSNAFDQQVVKEAGFLGAVGTWYGTTESEGDAYNWPRVRVVGGISLQQFAAII